jgi:hypothetical protein
MGSGGSPRDHVVTVVAAHGALTNAVADASHLMSAHARGQYAAHLDRFGAELNVAIGELGLWIDSLGNWERLDVGIGIHPPASGAETSPASDRPFEADLVAARETLKVRRGRLLSELAVARAALSVAGLPADELTAYRRVVRLWAGEAIDVVAAVHRLTLADSYIRRLSGHALRRDGARLLRQWMDELQAVDRDGELALAETCGYGDLVRSYRAEAV